MPIFFKSNLSLKPKFELPKQNFKYNAYDEFKILKSIKNIPMK